ncbi:MAG: tetratricopeptide repeat protein, partial [Kordiimonadaceae bacterium]|nr:tetratricopeptide repeat protein [Kordiimonadaceae bacterium]
MGNFYLVPVAAQIVGKADFFEVPELSAQEIRRREVAALIDLYTNALFEDPMDGARHQMLAKQYILQGVADIAEHELSRARELGIPKESLMADFGRAYLIRNKYSEIIEEVIIETAPPEDVNEITLILAHAYYGLKDYNRAFEYYKNVENLTDDKFFELNAPLAQIYNMGGHYELAEINADIALSFDAKNAEMLLLKGELVHRDKGASFSYVYFEKAAFYEPSNLKAQVKVAGALYNLCRHDEAMEVLLVILEQEREHPLANFLAASISAQNNNLRTARRYLDNADTGLDEFVPGLLLKGKLHYGARNYGQVESALNKLIVIEPNHMEARRFLAAALLFQEKNDQAVTVLEHIAQQNRLNNIDKMLLGSAYIQAGEYDMGSFYLKDAIAQDIDLVSENERASLNDFSDGTVRGVSLNIDGLINQSSSIDQHLIIRTYKALNKGQFDIVFDNAARLIEQNRRNPIGFNLLGLAYVGQNKLDEARSNFRKAIELDQNYQQARLNIAKLELSLGRQNAAIQSLNEILAVNESYLAAYETLAELAMVSNDTIRAERYLRTATQANPNSLSARSKLANFYFAENNLSKAKIVAIRMIRDFPDYGLPYKIMGEVSLREGAYTEAIENFERSIVQLSSDEKNYLSLSKAYVANEEAQKSRPMLEQAIVKVKNKRPIITALIELAEYDGNYSNSYHYIDQLKLNENEKAQAFIFQGELNLKQNNLEEAIKSFASANKAGGNKNTVIAGLEKIINSEL